MQFMAVLGDLERKIFFVAQPWWAKFIQEFIQPPQTKFRSAVPEYPPLLIIYGPSCCPLKTVYSYKIN